MRRISRFIAGVVLGAFTGGIIVTLFAPESGEVTREAIALRVENLTKQINNAISERREELHREIENYKNSATN